jgi:predicted acyl esterase
VWIASDAVDTDFAAKLIDVYPDGTALHIADGQILRATVINTRSRSFNLGSVKQPVCQRTPASGSK